jgi:hypothetical protein
MDGDRFDRLSRVLGGAATRRGVMTVLPALLGLGLGEAVQAKRGTAGKRSKQRRVRAEDSPQRKCKQADRPCSFDTHCCSGTCCNKICCGPDQQCNLNGQCVCKPDNAAACAGRECGTATNNCGQTVSCGPLNGACPQGKVCGASGTCGYDAGTCRQGDKTCGAKGIQFPCNEGTSSRPCFCWRTSSGGTICGANVECGETCSTDADCTAFGPGSACVDIEDCQCSSNPSPRVCVRPCV